MTHEREVMVNKLLSIFFILFLNLIIYIYISYSMCKVDLSDRDWTM